MDITRDEFNQLLEKANLTKKEFSDILGLNYLSVNNWGSSTIKVPFWVKSWLENYIKANDFNKVVEVIKVVKPYVD